MTVVQWSAIVGFALPALVAVVNREEWKPWIKAVIALGASVLVGTVTALLSGSFSGVNLATGISIVFASSQVAYHTWWKGSDIADKIEKGVNVISGKAGGLSLGGSKSDLLESR